MLRLCLAASLILSGCSKETVALYWAQGFECSGVVTHPGKILTAGHCTVQPLYFEGRRIGKSRRVGVDAAELEAPWVNGRVEWGTRAVVGDKIQVSGYGCTKGQKLSVRDGTVTEVWWDQVYTDIKGCKGDSGSPMFDSRHRLIGIITDLTNDTSKLVGHRVWP